MTTLGIGVDGAPGGWVAATITAPFRNCARHRYEIRVAFFERFSDIVNSADSDDVIVVDIPIGLSADGVRPADTAARERLGPRRSTFFPTPVRSVLDFDEWAQANAHSKQVCGKGLSKQAWNLTTKISEVDQVWSPELADRLFEGHPETSFAEMNGEPVLSKKATTEGRDERLALINSHFELDMGPVVSECPNKWRTDAIDALALGWTALRIIDGSAIRLGGELDEAGRPMELSI